MADIPPVSDPQLAAIIQQNKARRTRAVFIFVSVAVVLAIGLGGSAMYFSAQAKKKRNVAYSRVVKCLFGKPLAPGEPAMTRVRSAWRARILAEPKKDDDAPDTMEDQEAAKTKMWPNRCVAEMVAFTDTLKEVGEMKEGEKDLGFYSRELSKQTAGDNWKKVDTYQAAVEAFMTEADKGKFDFVDVPDVQAPELAEAESIDALFPKSTMLGKRVDAGVHEVVIGATLHFYLRAADGKPARLCTTSDGKTLACGEVVRGGLPTEAAGVPRLLGAEDGAPELLAFGEGGGMPAVFRSGDGARVLKAGEWIVVGGYSRPDGSAQLLVRDMQDRFKIGRFAANGTKLDVADIKVPDWNGVSEYVDFLGDRVLWVDSNNVLNSKTITATGEGPVQAIATLPGIAGSSWRRADAMTACQTKAGLAITVPAAADGASRLVVAFATPTGWGKADVVESGNISCGDDALYVSSPTALSTCKPDGCKGDPVEKQRGAAAVAIDGALVRANLRAGILKLTWERGGKVVQTKLYDAQMKGTTLLGEAKLTYVNMIARRGYALLAATMGEGQHFARVDGQGAAAPVSIKEE